MKWFHLTLLVLFACSPIVVPEKPTIVTQAVPVYPESARQEGIEGDVLVEMVVGADGMVQDVQILSGPSVFHESAREAAARMVFSPARQDHQSVRVKVLQRFSYRLSSQALASRDSTAVLSLNEEIPLLEYAEVEVKPFPVGPPVPEFPEIARGVGFGGEVVLDVIIGADGNVESAVVREGPPEFRGAAREAAKKMVFTPGMHGNRPVRVKAVQRIRFPFSPQ